MKRPAADAGANRPVAASAVLAMLAAMLVSGAAWSEPKLLAPERAFAFSVQPVDERTLEARFTIASGYYLYREKLKFSVEPASLAAAPVLPPGVVKEDLFFGNVETYRGLLAVRLPLDGAKAGLKVTVNAESQGCADVGVCYPPQVQHVTVALPPPGGSPGAPVEASPAKKSWFQ